MQRDVNHAREFLDESIDVLTRLDAQTIDQVAEILCEARDQGGRVFLCGSGGGAGHASHATCDFRTLAGLEAYCASDNVSELTARINDGGWADAYAEWLRASNLRSSDVLFVFSVGGGDEATGLSINLVRAMELAQSRGATVVGVAGRDGGALARLASVCVLIPTADPAHVTAQTEGLQALVWHVLVSNPRLATRAPTWESTGDATRR